MLSREIWGGKEAIQQRTTTSALPPGPASLLLISFPVRNRSRLLHSCHVGRLWRPRGGSPICAMVIGLGTLGNVEVRRKMDFRSSALLRVVVIPYSKARRSPSDREEVYSPCDLHHLQVNASGTVLLRLQRKVRRQQSFVKTRSQPCLKTRSGSRAWRRRVEQTSRRTEDARHTRHTVFTEALSQGECVYSTCRADTMASIFSRRDRVSKIATLTSRLLVAQK